MLGTLLLPLPRLNCVVQYLYVDMDMEIVYRSFEKFNHNVCYSTEYNILAYVVRKVCCMGHCLGAVYSTSTLFVANKTAYKLNQFRNETSKAHRHIHKIQFFAVLYTSLYLHKIQFMLLFMFYAAHLFHF